MIREQMMADFRAQLGERLPAFAFPASLVKVAGNIGPMILLGIYLAAALVAGEFEWGTVRTIHLTSRRGATLAVRIAVVVGLVAVATALGLVAAAIIPFLLSVEGRSLQDYAQPVPGLLSDVGIRLVFIVPFIAITSFMAVLTRSTSLAFLLTLLFFVLDGLVTSMAAMWESTPVAWLPTVTVLGSIQRLLDEPGSPLATLAPAWVSVAALLTWAIVPAAGAVALFRQLDLNE